LSVKATIRSPKVRIKVEYENNVFISLDFNCPLLKKWLFLPSIIDHKSK
jgi:hypothetical protein